MVWKKAAAAGDAGRTLTINLSAITKIDLQLVAYGGTAADPVAAITTRSDATATTSHTTPTVAVASSGAWLVSYWADKSSTTTSWTAPGGLVVRDRVIGTGGGRITSLLGDSGAVVPAGTAGGLTATTDAASRAATVSVVLAPAP